MLISLLSFGDSLKYAKQAILGNFMVPKPFMLGDCIIHGNWGCTPICRHRPTPVETT